jgi:archaellum component FlaC
MNIQTVANNLKRTIAGKEMLLETYKNPSVLTKPIRETMTHMLEINIDELKRILQDVEQCAKQASDDSWITNPDRMGGCYSEDELRNEGWK